jgi:hypothetical protein
MLAGGKIFILFFLKKYLVKRKRNYYLCHPNKRGSSLTIMEVENEVRIRKQE